MSAVEIHSDKLNKNFYFIKNDGNDKYVRLYNERTKNYDQICVSGGFMGNTVTANDENFEKICCKWLRKYEQNDRY